MLRKLVAAAIALVFFLGVLLALSPFLVWGGTLSIVALYSWVEQERREESLLGHIYRTTYSDSSKVALRKDVTSVPAENQPIVVTVDLWLPATRAAPDDIVRLSRDVRLRAARLGEDECRALLDTLASRCRLLSTDGGGSKSILLKLELVQKPPDATVGRSASREHDVVQVDRSDFHPGETSAGRWRLYARIAADCRQQKATFGSCNLLDLDARSSSFKEKDGRIVTRTDSHALFAVRRNFDVAELVRQGRGGL